MYTKIIADSTNPDNERITTMLCSYPRFIHSEHLRHRMFSFSVASSRAIPFRKQLKKVEEEPFIPILTMNKKGMQGDLCTDQDTQREAINLVRRLADNTAAIAKQLAALGLHKQIVNRYLEPFLEVSVLFTGTESAWKNFFALRCHNAAEPHIYVFADLCQAEYNTSTPNKLKWGEWHIPFGDKAPTADLTQRLDVSAARCARLSYETHDTKVIDVDADLALAERLWSMKHVSPFEHQALADQWTTESGNLRGCWQQLRHCREALEYGL